MKKLFRCTDHKAFEAGRRSLALWQGLGRHLKTTFPTLGSYFHIAVYFKKSRKFSWQLLPTKQSHAIVLKFQREKFDFGLPDEGRVRFLECEFEIRHSKD